MSYNHLLGRSRGPNNIVANPQRLESVNGKRYALGRNVKGEGKTPGTYVAVEVWTLKERVPNPPERDIRATVMVNATRQEAEEWVS